MTAQKHVRPLPLLEFVILMALLTSLGALSIDAILPALPEIGRSLNIQDSNDTQLLISMIMLGMSVGQLLYGPLCDSWGRKPSLYSGMVVFTIGSLISMYSNTLEVMLFGRIIQGFGLASTRVVGMALVRDVYNGREMARIMSIIMMIFILIPMIAPTIGQLIMEQSSWVMVFAAFVILAWLCTLWFGIRQQETLTAEDKKPFVIKVIFATFKTILTHKAVMSYTMAAGFVFGAFLSYLSASQAIFEQVFNIVDDFPKYFAAMAGSFGLAAYMNSRLVMRLGMMKMINLAIKGFVGLAIILLVITLIYDGVPPFWLFFGLALPLFFSLSLMFGNLNSIAMQPMGHMAGMAAAVIGFISTLMSVACSIFIGQQFNGTLTPFFIGYVVLGLAGWFMIRIGNNAATDIQD
ncbi:multidrug effflux MFS transporter [Gynuella sp.]|uniref:multidrug effflux MFS transporter n=1 Tax=Gynuella sp. TaxID=2969146 RepID=UPI003D0B3DFB